MESSLTYLRKCLGLTLEEFGDSLGGMAKSTISNWESAPEKIPNKKLDKIVKEFGIEKELIVEKMTPYNKLCIEEYALRYRASKSSDDEVLRDIEQSSHEIQIQKKFEKVVENVDASNVDIVERMFEVLHKKDGKALLNFLLKGAVEYQTGNKERLNVGKSNYQNNKFASKDKNLDQIVDILKIFDEAN